VLPPGADCIYVGEEEKMLVDSRVHQIWLQLLARTNCPDGVGVERIEDGYYLVVVDASRNSSPETISQMADYQALKSLIPHLGRTRSVYLNSSHAYQLAGITSLRDWAGQLAQKVESGACHAFAVIDPEVFQEHVRSQLQASGWTVERAGQSLRVSDRRFHENPNLLRAIVQMVLSRSNMREAALEIRDELALQFGIDARLFGRFKRRFAKYQPAVMDHYFTAYFECSCVAAGWDYWQVSGRTPTEAERTFEQAMQQFETFLAGSPDDWLPGFSFECCEANALEN
jgi:hypothetical protein